MRLEGQKALRLAWDPCRQQRAALGASPWAPGCLLNRAAFLCSLPLQQRLTPPSPACPFPSPCPGHPCRLHQALVCAQLPGRLGRAAGGQRDGGRLRHWAARQPAGGGTRGREGEGEGEGDSAVQAGNETLLGCLSTCLPVCCLLLARGTLLADTPVPPPPLAHCLRTRWRLWAASWACRRARAQTRCRPMRAATRCCSVARWWAMCRWAGATRRELMGWLMCASGCLGMSTSSSRRRSTRASSSEPALTA